MQRFVYDALLPSGEMEKGELLCESLSAAIQILESRGITVQSIHAADPPSAIPSTLEPPSDFYRQIEGFLTSSPTLLPALEALEKEFSTRKVGRDLRRLISNLRGSTNTQTMLRDGRIARWLPVILQGRDDWVSRGSMLPMLQGYMQEHEAWSRHKRALAYPLALFLVVATLIVILLIGIVPMFEKMNREFGIRAPQLTRILFQASNALVNFPLQSLAWIVGTILGSILLVRLWRRYAMTTRLFGFAIAGNSESIAAMGRFTRTLAELQAIRASLPESLIVSGHASQHPYLRSVAERLATAMRASDSIANTSSIWRALPSTVRHALRSGPNGAPNVPLLRELASMYDGRASRRFNWTIHFAGPVTVMLLGFLVGMCVIALFMPFLHVIGALSN